ncbi:sensor histidine kinase [Niabella hibiscisoli]|uniref:sensor histidine kinase n=1 Tax=Niabella hibiscisoli TaxID=1825928 RepID=UPI001F0D804A|nr:ATP-binding protein [Niabella hibiscisoli]MCH5718329.1 ATP-binding protein [Niabella hibiscisoli]
MMLQPIIENAIEHGVKNKGAQGMIKVDISTIIISGKEGIQIKITDNGAGVTQDVLKEGHALYILQKRMQTLEKKESVVAFLKHHLGEDGIGTIFKLVLSKTKNLWTP